MKVSFKKLLLIYHSLQQITGIEALRNECNFELKNVIHEVVYFSFSILQSTQINDINKMKFNYQYIARRSLNTRIKMSSDSGVKKKLLSGSKGSTFL